MDLLKYLLITLLCAGVLGAIFGVVIGKHLVKRAKYGSKPLLGKKERLVYLGCLALGVTCICFGLFFKLPVPPPANPEGEFTFAEGEDAGGTGGSGMARRPRNGAAVAVRIG